MILGTHSHLLWRSAIFLIAFPLVVSGGVYSSDQLRNDICISGSYGAKRFYLEEGDNGTLTATTPRVEDWQLPGRSYLSFASQLSVSGLDPARGGQCSVELNSCPSCSVKITFQFQNVSKCQKSTPSQICGGCDYVTIKENVYTAPVYFCADADARNHEFRSVGRSVFASFIFNKNSSNILTIDYSINRNSETIFGSPGDRGIIKSPFFPNPYPRDYTSEIKFQGRDPRTLIRINFDDFQLTPWSFIEIFESNHSRSHVLTGNSFRPPVLTSQTNSVVIRFYANGGRATGFKFSYEFLKEKDLDLNATTITDCGGWVDNMGGAITMMNMTLPNTTANYDCLWLLKPQVNYQLKSNLAVRVAQFFSSDRYSTSLEIRQGLTSESPLIETITWLKSPSPEFVVPWDAGFYIRLRGVLRNDFKMALVYNTFTYSLVPTDCFSYTDFLCHNHRCINSDLRCDGFDHCGDLSDEPSACRSGSATPQDPSWWYTHTPNYYFPKSSDLVDFGATTFILLTATIGVVIFVASLIALLFRMSSHSRLMRERQARIEFLHSQLVANEPVPPPPENPPCYEAPPDYAEILKINEIKSLESEYNLEGRLRVLLPPTPVPVHRDSESYNISIISTAPSLEGLAGSESHVAGGSQASTPSCRSRASTPRRKARRQHKGNHTPRKCHTVIQENVPTSPPPAYDASENSVFNFEMPTEQLEKATVIVRPECDCPGACNCSNLVAASVKERSKFNWSKERGYSAPGFEDLGNRSLDIYFSHNQLHTERPQENCDIHNDDMSNFRMVRRILSLHNFDRPRFDVGNKLWKSFSWPNYTRRLD